MRTAVRSRSTRSLLALVVMLWATACGAQDPLLPGPPPPPPPPPQACVMPTGALPAAAVSVSVSPTIRFQTLAGFGTSVRLFDDSHLTNTADPATQRSAVLIPAVEQARILAALYGELGLTRVRYATDPGVELTNDNTEPEATDLSKFDFRWKRLDGHVDFVKSVRPLGVTVWYGSPILLEPWMSHENPAEYVEWAMAIIRRWRDQGATLTYWSIANEPGYVSNLSPTFIRDAVKAIGARLAAEGIATKLVIPDDADPAAALVRAQTVLADPVARQYVAALATHVYVGSGIPAQPQLAKLAELAALAKQYGLPLWMSEWFNPDWFVWAKTMHILLAEYDVAAIDYLWGFFGQYENIGAQLITINHTGSLYSGFVKNKQYWTFGQYTRFLPAGSVRVQTQSSDAAVLVSGYLVGNQIVLVALNSGAGEKSVQFALGNGSPCVLRFTAERTTPFETARVLDPATLTGPGFTTSLPGTSISTFVITP